jgi:hypothetical protein
LTLVLPLADLGLLPGCFRHLINNTTTKYWQLDQFLAVSIWGSIRIWPTSGKDILKPRFWYSMLVTLLQLRL